MRLPARSLINMQIPKLDKKIETIVIGSGFLLVLILLYAFPGRALFKQKSKLRGEFLAHQESLKESEGLIRAFPHPQKEIAEIENKAQELRDMGASTRQLPRIIQLLAVPANQLNINVISIRPRDDLNLEAENLPPGVTKVYIELLMNCPYQLFAEYTKAVSGLPTSFIMERMSIEKRGEEDAPAYQAKASADKTGDKSSELYITMLLSTYLILDI